ncbi:ABC transporter permease [Rothia aeria]|mgnify:CR=1 FL=1|jgi:putative aliphatic sulfonates transport permease protein ssuC|uniref:ABC transporter permease n=1 Tax=Rothia aeria TaxID=172042 RepID=UPI00254FABB5|nr:ABC transporter permease [Rothia aeria]MDK7352064.1 ABC transporter permease [Rothia aeria]
MSVTLDKISDAPELSDAPKHTKSAAAETATAHTAATSTAAGRTPASPRRDQPRPRRALPLGAKHYVGLILPAALITLWYVLSTAGVFTAVQLPSPTRVIAAGTELAQRGELATHLVISTQRVVLGFSIGAVLGLVLGALIGLWGPARIAAAPTIGALRAVPSLAWVPLLLLWIGIGENSKVTLVAIGAFFPVYTTVSAALAHVDPKLVEAARAFGYRGVKLFTTVQLPAVLPSVVSGLRLALAQAWLFLVAAELLGASMGLGYLLTDSQNNGRTDRLLLAIVLLAVLGKLTDALIGVFERWVKAKYPSN